MRLVVALQAVHHQDLSSDAMFTVATAFGSTLVDIAELKQLYRILVLLVLGLLLLTVTWGYHKAFQSREAEP